MSPGPATPAPPPNGPLHIDRIAPDAAGPGSGSIGMTHCPGRSGTDDSGRHWQRDLAQDVSAIRSAGFGTVLSLLGPAELAALGAGALHARLQEAGVHTLQFPIVDFGVPDAQAQVAWRAVQANVLARLRSGDSVLVHCAAGLGRTGTMVAVLLKALGQPAEVAMDHVRAARPGTIETAAQADFVLRFVP